MTRPPCYICNEREFQLIFEQKPSMTSDALIVDIAIQKEECINCGTVRSAGTSFLQDFYEVGYQLNTENKDPMYVYKDVVTSKSEMHYEWIIKIVGDRLDSCNNMIEVGCGSGNLLSLFPVREKFGVEPSSKSAQFAASIAYVRNIGYELISDKEKYDFILSTCVIEHTIDPEDFLKKIHSISHPESLIVIGLPLQDTESFDVFFLDHLHHFSSSQFKQLCNKNGFEVLNYEVGYKCMTTIGYFLLQKIDLITTSKKIKFEKNTNFYKSSVWIKNLNEFLKEKSHSKIIAFGFGETSFFFQAYSDLSEKINCFIDDVKVGKDKRVIGVKEAINTGKLCNSTLVLLTNPHYHSFLKKKFELVEDIKFFSPFFMPEV